MCVCWGGGWADRIKECHNHHLHSELSEQGLWSLGWDACTGAGSHQGCKNTSSLIKQQPQKGAAKAQARLKKTIFAPLVGKHLNVVDNVNTACVFFCQT